MIERSGFVELAGDWHLHTLEVTNDRLLSAFVSLRLITSTHFGMMTTQHVQHQRQEPAHLGSLLRLLDRQIIEWQSKWTATVAARGEDCHAFLIPFYGSYARLLLFTAPLRASMRVKDIVTSVDTEAIWNSCWSALDMLKLVSEPSASQLVYFAQDSVHVMVAYATVFLIKVPALLVGRRARPLTSNQLLVSVPAYLSNEMELQVLNSISNSASVFAALRAPSDTSYSLQVVFLRNVLVEYELIKERRTPPRADVPIAAPAAAEHTTPQTAFDCAQMLQPADAISACADRHIGNFSTQDSSSFGLDFANDQVWALIFANAGFNVDQGAFLVSS
jgi:hypothetical protein